MYSYPLMGYGMTTMTNIYIYIYINKSTERGVCVYYCRTYYKAVRGGGEEESGGHVL
jgi:hypothetical protein